MSAAGLFGWAAAVGAVAGAGLVARSAAVTGRVRDRLALPPERRAATGRIPVVSVSEHPGPTGRFAVLRRRLAWLRPSGDVEHAMVLEAVARALRGGSSLAQAVDEAAGSLASGDAVGDLRNAMRSVRSGVPLADALTIWADRGDDEARVLAGAALTLGADVGGASARSLDAAAGGLRDRAALSREVRALTSQARASALVMVLAPLGFVVLAGATDRRITTTLLATPLGLACVTAGLGLDGAGAFWMARMTRRVS
jgi:Flp pilus assembly protein TadB